MNHKYIALFVFLLLVIPLSSSREIYQQNQDINFAEKIVVNNFPIPSTRTNLTIEDPDGIPLAQGENMSYNPSTSKFNFTLPGSNTSKIGVYEKCILAIYEELNKTTCEEFEVTPTGKEFATSQAVLYFVILLFSIGIFGLTFMGFLKVPFRDRGDDDSMMGLPTKSKYLKIFLGFMSYVMALWILAIGSNLTKNFLFFSDTVNYFNFIYNILLSFFYPMIIILFVFSIVTMLHDKKVAKSVRRGLPLR